VLNGRLEGGFDGKLGGRLDGESNGASDGDSAAEPDSDSDALVALLSSMPDAFRSDMLNIRSGEMLAVIGTIL
jgi:hypothetical protein